MKRDVGHSRNDIRTEIMNIVVLFTNTISPHQLPLAKELAARVGDKNFRYIYTEVADKDHCGLGWALDVPDWCIHASCDETDNWLENSDTLLSGLRCFDLFVRRAKKGLKNYYMTERWFKPPIGIFRLLHPRYFGYARRLCRMMGSGDVVGLPIGIHAARDMARLCGLMHGDLRCLSRAPELDFERRPGGRIYIREQGIGTREQGKKYCLDKMRMWGYFVEPSTTHSSTPPHSHAPTLKVLWVGRLLNLKRVDTIIRAVGELATNSISDNLHSPNSNSNSPTHPLNHPQLSLNIYGTGPEETRLKKLAAKYDDVIKFYPPVPIDEVRRLMREHNIYVLASNAYEGWGAVVSEALEEGMKVIGTYEAGSSATILPKECLFHAGDWKGLFKLLKADVSTVGIGNWCAAKAVEVIDA